MGNLAIMVAGWVGAGLVLGAFGLNTRGRLTATSLAYLAMNAAGSIGLAVSTASAHAWPSAAVNVIWLGLGLPPLVRAGRQWRSREREAGGSFTRRRRAAPRLERSPSSG